MQLIKELLGDDRIERGTVTYDHDDACLPVRRLKVLQNVVQDQRNMVGFSCRHIGEELELITNFKYIRIFDSGKDKRLGNICYMLYERRFAVFQHAKNNV